MSSSSGQNILRLIFMTFIHFGRRSLVGHWLSTLLNGNYDADHGHGYVSENQQFMA